MLFLACYYYLLIIIIIIICYYYYASKKELFFTKYIRLRCPSGVLRTSAGFYSGSGASPCSIGKGSSASRYRACYFGGSNGGNTCPETRPKLDRFFISNI